jgi:hypothetical protein
MIGEHSCSTILFIRTEHACTTPVRRVTLLHGRLQGVACHCKNRMLRLLRSSFVGLLLGNAEIALLLPCRCISWDQLITVRSLGIARVRNIGVVFTKRTRNNRRLVHGGKYVSKLYMCKLNARQGYFSMILFCFSNLSRQAPAKLMQQWQFDALAHSADDYVFGF